MAREKEIRIRRYSRMGSQRRWYGRTPVGAARVPHRKKAGENRAVCCKGERWREPRDRRMRVKPDGRKSSPCRRRFRAFAKTYCSRHSIFS